MNDDNDDRSCNQINIRPNRCGLATAEPDVQELMVCIGPSLVRRLSSEVVKLGRLNLLIIIYRDESRGYNTVRRT